MPAALVLAALRDRAGDDRVIQLVEQAVRWISRLGTATGRFCYEVDVEERWPASVGPAVSNCTVPAGGSTRKWVTGCRWAPASWGRRAPYGPERRGRATGRRRATRDFHEFAHWQGFRFQFHGGYRAVQRGDGEFISTLRGHTMPTPHASGPGIRPLRIVRRRVARRIRYPSLDGEQAGSLHRFAAACGNRPGAPCRGPVGLPSGRRRPAQP